MIHLQRRSNLLSVRCLAAVLCVGYSIGCVLCVRAFYSTTYLDHHFFSLSTMNEVVSSTPRRSARLQARTTATTQIPTAAPLWTAGLLTDIQYAPIPDGYSYSGMPRYYRSALTSARMAAQHLARAHVDCVWHLGDIVDGKCQALQSHGGSDMDDDPGIACCQHVLEALSDYQQGPIYHTYGNHCLYNMNRETMQQLLDIPFVREEPSGDLVGYRSIRMPGNTRIVVLDSYDVSLLQRSPDSIKYQQAVALLHQHNPNYPHAENSPQGMVGLHKRFVAFNGGVGPVQLAWLERTLEEARHNNERVILLSHQPMLPGSTAPICLMWNYQDVLQILRRYKDVVVASLSGHAHHYGYKRDASSGIHFRVLEAILEHTEPTYAILECYVDRLVVRGYGSCESAVYPFDPVVPCRASADSALEATVARTEIFIQS
jgi:manganese-dependent ADP-ribose/CDP-alcohol diphosphatase